MLLRLFMHPCKSHTPCGVSVNACIYHHIISSDMGHMHTWIQTFAAMRSDLSKTIWIFILSSFLVILSYVEQTLLSVHVMPQTWFQLLITWRIWLYTKIRTQGCCRMLISLHYLLLNATLISQILWAEKHILHDIPLDHESIFKWEVSSGGISVSRRFHILEGSLWTWQNSEHKCFLLGVKHFPQADVFDSKQKYQCVKKINHNINHKKLVRGK